MHSKTFTVLTAYGADGGTDDIISNISDWEGNKWHYSSRILEGSSAHLAIFCQQAETGPFLWVYSQVKKFYLS